MVGGFNTFLGFSSYPILYFLLPPLRTHYVILLIICQIICITNAYFTNKYLVFKVSGLSFWEFIKFTTFYNIAFAINLFVLPFLVEVAKFNPIIVQVVINCIITVSSYFWHNHITFLNRHRHTRGDI